MSANVGAALSMLTRPEQYPDPGFSDRLRDAVIDSLTRPAEPAQADGVPVAAATLAARLRVEPARSAAPRRPRGAAR